MVQTIFAGAADADQRPGNVLKIDHQSSPPRCRSAWWVRYPAGCHLALAVGPAGVVDQRRQTGVPEDVNLRAKAPLAKPAAISLTRALTAAALLLWVRSIPSTQRSPAARSSVPPRIRVTLGTTESRCSPPRLATLCSTVTSWLASRIASFLHVAGGMRPFPVTLKTKRSTLA